MGPPSYMWSVDRIVVMQRIPVHRLSYENWTLQCISTVESLNFPTDVCGCPPY